MLLGLAAQAIGSRTHVPRVTILIGLGIAIGPVGFDLLPDLSARWFDYITTVALTMIGFLLGGKLNRDALDRYGAVAFGLSLVITLGTFALVLAGVSLATDPIATLDIIDTSPVRSRLAEFLPPIVALDDAWGLLLFSIVVTMVHLLANGSVDVSIIAGAAYELGGSIVLGAALGLPMALLSGRIKQGEPTLVEALGMVMLCAGLSLWLGLSYLLAAIVMGMTVSFIARHHKFAFHEIEHIEWPILILFLVLVGASFTPGNWAAISMIGLGYVAFRLLGRIAGAPTCSPDRC